MSSTALPYFRCNLALARRPLSGAWDASGRTADEAGPCLLLPPDLCGRGVLNARAPWGFCAVAPSGAARSNVGPLSYRQEQF